MFPQAGESKPQRISRAPRLETSAVIEVASFRAALRSFLGDSDRLARSSGLTPQRHLLLLMIKGAPDGSERATVSELVDRLQLAQNTVTELAQRAEKLGLIEREPSETDGRVTYLRLTEEGERRLAEAFTKHDVARAQLRRAISALESETDAGRVGRAREVRHNDLRMRRWSLTGSHDPGRSGPWVLFSTPEARGVVIDLAADEEMGDHRVRERAIVQVTRGSIALTCGGETTTCDCGTLLVLEPSERHAVRALEQTRLLLILAPWPAPHHYDAAEHEDPHELPVHATQEPG